MNEQAKTHGLTKVTQNQNPLQNQLSSKQSTKHYIEAKNEAHSIVTAYQSAVEHLELDDSAKNVITDEMQRCVAKTYKAIRAQFLDNSRLNQATLTQTKKLLNQELKRFLERIRIKHHIRYELTLKITDLGHLYDFQRTLKKNSYLHQKVQKIIEALENQLSSTTLTELFSVQNPPVLDSGAMLRVSEILKSMSYAKFEHIWDIQAYLLDELQHFEYSDLTCLRKLQYIQQILLTDKLIELKKASMD